MLVNSSRFHSAFAGAFLLLFLFVLSDTALAQASGGFLSSATSTAQKVFEGLQWLLLAIAVGVIGWNVFQVTITHEKTWGDILKVCIGMVALGAALPVGKELYEYGKTISIF